MSTICSKNDLIEMVTTKAEESVDSPPCIGGNLPHPKFQNQAIDTEDIWKLYFHDPNDKNWAYDSYKLIGQISSANEFNGIHDEVKDIIHNGMFFIMREHIFPSWDDPENIRGGCLCIKIQKQAVSEFWKDLCSSLLGETIVHPNFRHIESTVNGASISPKNFFCIIKIWFNNDLLCKVPGSLILPQFDGQTIYKANDEESQKFSTAAS